MIEVIYMNNGKADAKTFSCRLTANKFINSMDRDRILEILEEDETTINTLYYIEYSVNYGECSSERLLAVSSDIDKLKGIAIEDPNVYDQQWNDKNELVLEENIDSRGRVLSRSFYSVSTILHI